MKARSPSPPSEAGAPVFDDRFRERLRDLFAWRRDVRHFLATSVDDAVIDRLVRTASLAPSVGYAQPWRFVRVDDAGRRAQVVASFERSNAEALAAYEGDDAALYARLKLAGLRDAPVHLAVFCDESTPAGRGLGRRTMPEMLAYSAANAVYAFWLAARAEGVGAGWVSILEPDAVKAALEVPEEWKLIAYLCVGYPVEAHATPELQRAGWESRDERATTLYRR
ncbi:MAG TPA: 5,6-dimethylbenzimidazole synthase [Candidatus Acidoferrales bacterium]|nr:5,6-dimethylbenzimidazole synthase [Candidatus Acidoferrales bacterium]